MGAKVLALTLALILISYTPTLAQEGPGFSVSPGDFTVRDAPPYGEPYRLERKLVIFNGDNIKRIFILTVEVPENLENLPPGYTAIPDNRWILLISPGGGQTIEVDENSYGEVEIWLNIPYWENLTSQKWEAWISVRRQAEIGETLEPVITCKAWIETSAELPPPPSKPRELPIALILAMAVVVVGVSLGIWAWSRGRKVVKRRGILGG